MAVPNQRLNVEHCPLSVGLGLRLRSWPLRTTHPAVQAEVVDFSLSTRPTRPIEGVSACASTPHAGSVASSAVDGPNRPQCDFLSGLAFQSEGPVPPQRLLPSGCLQEPPRHLASTCIGRGRASASSLSWLPMNE